ncbi:hypothetical protein HY224_00915 [Candidatus Uhrbacteria bacterium]|nr:hypothetical protein [Candidatus Uhrbacteria bacterium]
MTYSMTCSCGDTVKMEAGNRDEAVAKFQGMMTEGAIAKHMAEKHPGDPVMSVAQCHQMISQEVQPKA